jgi:Glycosyltransferase 61
MPTVVVRRTNGAPPPPPPPPLRESIRRRKVWYSVHNGQWRRRLHCCGIAVAVSAFLIIALDLFIDLIQIHQQNQQPPILLLLLPKQGRTRRRDANQPQTKRIVPRALAPPGTEWYPEEWYGRNRCRILWFYTPPRTATHGCWSEVPGPDETSTVGHCAFAQWRIDPSKIFSVAHEGEPLAQVMGQAESDEQLHYQKGAFVTHQNYTLSTHSSSLFYLQTVLDNLVLATVGNSEWSRSCQNVAPGVTLFLQRDEYVNLYHTMTDVWNTWEVYRQLDHSQPVRVVFLDAHPMGLLDEVWSTLFGTVERVNDLLDRGTACFESVRLIPSGYTSRLGHSQLCTDPVVMNEFVDFVLHKYHLESIRMLPGRVSLIDRQSFVAHARNQPVPPGSDAREIDNLNQVATWIQQRIPQVSAVHVLSLHTMTFREQLRAIRESELVIGNHGAGLTHLLFLDNHTHVIEFQVRSLDVFRRLQRWKPNVSHYSLTTVEYTLTAEYFETNLLPTLTEIYPSTAT